MAQEMTMVVVLPPIKAMMALATAGRCTAPVMGILATADLPMVRAVGGGLLGYQLGQMAGEHDQQHQEGDAGNPDQMATLDAGGYDPGMADSVGSYDAGGFSDFGGDFGGGDFGGIEM